MMQYDVIYADPPWSYNDPGAIRRFSGTRKGRADAHYGTEGVQDLAAMRPMIDEWAAPDCALLMWGTWPKLPEHLALGQAWGFEWVTCALLWCKTYASDQQWLSLARGQQIRPYCGMGFYTRSGSEFCGLWRRGKPLVPADRTIRQVIHAPVREHSRKPDEARHSIEAMWPDARRIEMFARTTTPGWDAWGNETEKFSG